ESGRLPQRNLRLRVHTRKGPIESREVGTAQESVEQIRSVALRQPIAFFEHDRNASGRIRILKNRAGLQGFFQSGKRKSRVDGEESSLGIRSFEIAALLSAVRTLAVSEHIEQRLGFLTIRDPNDG